MQLRVPAILLSLSSDHCPGRADRRDADVAAAMVFRDLIAEHRLAATWTSRSPVDWQIAQDVAAMPRQEVALTVGECQDNLAGRRRRRKIYGEK